MELSLSTVFLPDNRFHPDTVLDDLRPIKEAGFTHIQWAYNWNTDYLFTHEEMRQGAGALNTLGLKCKDLHASHGWKTVKFPGHPTWREATPGDTDIASLDEDCRKRGSALVRNRLELAAELGAESIVLHIFPPYHRFNEPGIHEKHYAQAFKTLDENEAFARDHGIRVCVENQTGIPQEILFDEFDRFFANYSPEYIGYCCDTGHLYISHLAEPLATPRKYKDRMYAIHLNDNLGPEREGITLPHKQDAHMVMGDGIVDFDAFAQIVAESPYTYPVVGEFRCYEPTLEEFFTKCRTRMTAFAEQVEALRSNK